LGFKTETEDRRFGADLSAYYIDWSNFQVLTTRNGIGVTTNSSGDAVINGAELTLTARPVHQFQVTGAFAYQNARLSEADADLGAQAHERLPSVPRFTAAINADYTGSSSSLQPTVGASLRYVSGRTTSFGHSTFQPDYRLPDYVTVDVRAGLSFGSVQTQFYVRNVFDSRGELFGPTGTSAFGGPIQAAILQPRTVGVSVSRRF
jgi:outer membrane receptor for monomeric catechols